MKTNKKPHALSKYQIARVKRWIKALRSGKYKQTQSVLVAVDRDGTESYCCLGVACMILKAPRTGSHETEFRGETYVLPNHERKLLGLVDDGGIIDSGPSLITRNDNGWSFHRIADFVERQLKTNNKGLFKRK